MMRALDGVPPRKIVSGALFFAFIVFLYAPSFLLPIFSFNDSVIVSFPLRSFTLRWYEMLWDNSGLWDALWNSIVVASVTSIVATASAVLAALGILSGKLRRAGQITALLVMPMAIPSIIIGIGLLLVFLTILGMPLSRLTVTIGHLLICIPLALLIVIPRIEGFDKNLLEASFDLGRSRLNTFFHVTLPIISPGILASLLICFVTSFDEFTIAYFLSAERVTLPVYIFAQLRLTARFPELLALSSCIIASSVLLLILARCIAGPEAFGLGKGKK
jgi:spermidine/putrescine transport system permease protein